MWPIGSNEADKDPADRQDCDPIVRVVDHESDAKRAGVTTWVVEHCDRFTPRPTITFFHFGTMFRSRDKSRQRLSRRLVLVS